MTKAPFFNKVGFPQSGVFYKGSLHATIVPDLLKVTVTLDRQRIISNFT